MSDFNVLKEYYIRYLKNVRHASDSTVNHYIGALNTISKYLVIHGKVEETLYELNELNDLMLVREYLYSQPDFIIKDERGNRMYSAGLNNYIRFAEGEEFQQTEKQSIVQMDIVVPIGGKMSSRVEQWRRNGIIKKQSIEMANYFCEVEKEHTTFIAAASGHQYMEGHHAIPMFKQANFEVSLDVYANIVCLCPICHRLMHYGRKEDRSRILGKLYIDRADRLAQSGISLSKDEFIMMSC